MSQSQCLMVGSKPQYGELAKQLHDAGHEVHLYGGNGDVRHELAGRQIHIHTYPYTPREKVIDLGGRFSSYC